MRDTSMTFNQVAAPIRHVFLVIMMIAGGLTFSAGTASAQDGVWVSFHGGTSRADGLELVERDGDWIVSEQGQRVLLSEDLGLQVIRDHKLLPNGSNLLAGVGGRGFAQTDESGNAEVILSSPDTYPRATSASVMVYAAPGEPGRILLTDSNTTRLLIIEPEDGDVVWQAGFQLPGSVGLFADAIALPDQRVASAVEYTSLGISAIDIFEFSPGPTSDQLRRITNRQHPEGPPNQVVVDGLHPIKDMLGLPNGNLLIATNQQLFEVSLDGALEWSTQVSGTQDIGGEVSSIALMPSGRVAVATLESGEWTRPHPNHRIYWLERGPLEQGSISIEGKSSALRRAPAGLETRGGHGGSGTFGFRPGLDQGSDGELSDLAVARPLQFSKDEYQRRETVAGSVVVRNEGDSAVFISTLTVRAVSGECGSMNNESPITLFENRFIDMDPADVFDVRGGLDATGTLEVGRWCAQTFATDRAGTTTTLGSPAYFEIVESSSDAGGSSVIVRDVGFWEADAFDGSSSDTGQTPATLPVDAANQTMHRQLSSRALAFFGLVLLVGWVRSRRH